METIGLPPISPLTSERMCPSMSSWPSLTPAPWRWRATPSISPASRTPSRIPPSRVSKASAVILPEGVAEAKTVGISSKPCLSHPSIRPPTGVLVPLKKSKTSSPYRSLLLLNSSRSVLMLERTLVSWDMVPVTMRIL